MGMGGLPPHSPTNGKPTVQPQPQAWAGQAGQWMEHHWLNRRQPRLVILNRPTPGMLCPATLTRRYLHLRMHPFSFMRCTATNWTGASGMLPETIAGPLTKTGRWRECEEEDAKPSTRRWALARVEFC